MLRMDFDRLHVWKKSMQLAKNVHTIAKVFPKEEVYGLTSQLRRACVSVPSNIAEGSQRTSDREFANFILIAKGSLAEIKTQLLLAQSFQYITEEENTGYNTLH